MFCLPIQTEGLSHTLIQEAGYLLVSDIRLLPDYSTGWIQCLIVLAWYSFLSFFILSYPFWSTPKHKLLGLKHLFSILHGSLFSNWLRFFPRHRKILLYKCRIVTSVHGIPCLKLQPSQTLWLHGKFCLNHESFSWSLGGIWRLCRMKNINFYVWIKKYNAPWKLTQS